MIGHSGAHRWKEHRHNYQYGRAHWFTSLAALKLRTELLRMVLILVGMVAGGATPLFAQLITVQCQAHVVDKYGNGASGASVSLTGFITTADFQDLGPIVSTTAVTDENGDATAVLPNDSYKDGSCTVDPASNGYTLYGSSQSFSDSGATRTISVNMVVVPKPDPGSLAAPGGGNADLYRSGTYGKPIVIAQPFFTDEPTLGRKSASQNWLEYNGNPALLSQGLLELLHSKGYNVWLFRPKSTGSNIHDQAADLAWAVEAASKFESYNGKVAVAGYSMGGLVVRTALSRWDWDANWRAGLGLEATLPVNLIVTLDSPLRGAIVNNDLQHAFWNVTGDNGGQTAKDHNMDSCAAQQMLENACHKTLNDPNGDDLECNDRGWYSTFFSGSSFAYCSPAGSSGCIPNTVNTGVKICSNPGVGILTQPNGGWPAGIKKIAASMGKFFERTGVCYGDSDPFLRDKTGDLTDGCPDADTRNYDLDTEWGYIGIELSHNRIFKSQAVSVSADPTRQHIVDELTPGSRQPASVEDVASSIWIFKMANGHQLLHAGTFIPLYSALDMDPSTGSVPFDEYWTNSYSAFHDALSDKLPGNWVNQHTLLSGQLTLPAWLVKNLDDAFTASNPVGGCGEPSCVPAQGAYISHFTGAGCTGTESYYTPYDGGAFSCRTWDGGGQCGTVHRTVTNVSYKFNGVCTDAWPAGNTLSDFVTVYRGSSTGGVSSFVLSVGRAGTGTGTVSSSPAGISCGASCSSSFTSGTVVTLTASPAAGSTFAGWSGAGCAGTGACSVTMNAAQSVTATFNNVLFSLTVTLAGTGTGTVSSSPAGISCAGTCGNSFNAGTTVTLTASPAAGSAFAGWSGAGCTGTGACLVTMNAAQSVIATFNTVASGCGEASCVPAQAAYVSHFSGPGCTGTESYYTPYDEFTYSCRTWDGAGQCGTIHRTVTNFSYKFNGVCTDAWPGGNTLSDFVTVYRGTGGVSSFVLSVGRAGTGAGTVSSTPAGISCGASCSSSFTSGTVVTLTASPAAGSTFAGWSGAGCTGAGACSVTMNAARSVIATFNMVASGCGEASCVPAQAAYISHFTGAGCTGTESYYTPYDGGTFSCRTWDGGGQCGTTHRTVTNVSYKFNGVCSDAWPGGNTLSDFVTIYR
jgi:Divergent InlB B-repeat domain